MDIPVISRWFDKLLSPSQPDPESANILANTSGVDLAQDNATPLPMGVGSLLTGDDLSFFKYWLSTYKSYDEDRLSRYKTYEVMDVNSTEVSLMLDTYAAEALSIGFIDHPLTIQFSDPKAEQEVLSILYRSDFFNQTLANVRSLAKYGDLFYRITIDEGTGEVSIRKMNPSQITAVEVKGFSGILGYKINATGADTYRKNYNQGSPVLKDHILKPWDVIQFTIHSDEFAPYGKSEIEKVRSAYDQLITMEALFAISRANRVERLVIKVPTNLSNPTSAFAKLQQLKAQIKSVVLGQGSQGRFTANKEWGLTDVLFMPADKDFDIDKLASSIDISSDEDVRYFLEKMINGGRLPKGFMSGDEVTDRGSMLQQQDLKFSRSIIPLQQAYVAGVVKLCTVLAILRGYKNCQVTASLEKPNQVTSEQIRNYSEQMQAASNFIKTYMELAMPDQLGMPGQPMENVSEDGEGPPSGDQGLAPMIMPKKISPELFISIMMKFGVPKTIATSIIESPENLDVPNTKVTNTDSMVNLSKQLGNEGIKFTSNSIDHSYVTYIKENYKSPTPKTRKRRSVEVELS